MGCDVFATCGHVAMLAVCSDTARDEHEGTKTDGKRLKRLANGPKQGQGFGTNPDSDLSTEIGQQRVAIPNWGSQAESTKPEFL